MDKEMQLSDLVEIFNQKFSRLEQSINQIDVSLGEIRKEMHDSKVDFVENKTETIIKLKETSKDLDNNFSQHREFYERLGNLERSKELTSERHEKIVGLIDKLENKIDMNEKDDVSDKEELLKVIEETKEKIDDKIEKQKDENEEFRVWVKGIYIKATTFITIVGTALAWGLSQLMDFIKK